MVTQTKPSDRPRRERKEYWLPINCQWGGGKGIKRIRQGLMRELENFIVTPPKFSKLYPPFPPPETNHNLSQTNHLKVLTCKLFGFSIFLIHLFAWPWGSIINGQRWEFVTIIALSSEKLKKKRSAEEEIIHKHRKRRFEAMKLKKIIYKPQRKIYRIKLRTNYFSPK